MPILLNKWVYLPSIPDSILHPTSWIPLAIVSDNGYYVNFDIYLQRIGLEQNTPAPNQKMTLFEKPITAGQTRNE